MKKCYNRGWPKIKGAELGEGAEDKRVENQRGRKLKGVRYLIYIKYIDALIETDVQIIEHFHNLEGRTFCTESCETNNVREEDSYSVEVLCENWLPLF